MHLYNHKSKINKENNYNFAASLNIFYLFVGVSNKNLYLCIRNLK